MDGSTGIAFNPGCVGLEASYVYFVAKEERPISCNGGANTAAVWIREVQAYGTVPAPYEVFPSAVDLGDVTLRFAAEHYSTCLTALTTSEYPVSTASATALDLTDNSFQEISFSSGFSFKYYGTTYTSVGVSTPSVLQHA